MKKLTKLLVAFNLVYATVALTVACDIGSTDGYNYLASLPNFNWEDGDYGDGIDFNNTNSQHALANAGSQTKLNDVVPNNSGNFLDYSRFNTGFQWVQNIKKQAVTGVPLNEGFMPNGNYAADFGITSAAERYLRLNSILDWNPNQDADAKYNQAVVPLQPREFVASANPNQDENVNYNQLSFSSRKHRTFDNTIVGTNNPFEDTVLNWQDINTYVNWSGSWFEGPIVPPPADVIDQAHTNGVPIYGNVFLDGYHGLTKDMLKDFVAQNPDGSYKIVDILINIAAYNHFDGWFINDEANGAAPNGAVLDYNVMYQIMKEFNDKVASSKNRQIKQLKLTFYRNDASLEKDTTSYDDPETLKMTESGHRLPDGTITPTDIQLNFGQTPGQTTDFLNEHPNYSGKNLATMIDGEANSSIFGTYDFRQLAYVEKFSGNQPSYDKNNYTGFSGFLGAGTGSFGSFAYDWVKEHKPKVTNVRAYLFATQTANLLNTIQFSGTNTFTASHDTGMQLNKTINDYNGLDASNFSAKVFACDPRINITDKGPKDAFVNANIYNYWNHQGNNTSSFGIGDLVRERTTLFDDHQNLNRTTNFSMGSGIKFVNRDENGKAIIASDYPWTNRRLSDMLPTYQWRVYHHKNPDQTVDISKLAGFYDYDTVYQKGNSIALGGGFDETGRVIPATWNPGQLYDWDIMGTNLINNNHIVNFIYHDGSSNNDNTQVKFLITSTNQTSASTTQTAITPTATTRLKDGWVKIQLNLNAINTSTAQRIAKIGLQIIPNKTSFKFNVGEFQITTPSLSQEQVQKSVISKAVSEYLIKRTVNEHVSYNVRFQWDDSNFNNVNYYAIYYFNNNKWYRVGETTQTCYFLKNLSDTNHYLKLMIKPIVNHVMTEQAFVFQIMTD